MTQYPATRTVATQPAPASGSLDLKTLLITALSSAAAAYTCSKLWTPGTLAAAAFTPVLVAVLREGLAKSTAVVASAVPVRGVVRSGAAPRDPQPPGVAEGGDRSFADVAAAEQPPIGEPLDAGDPAARVAQAGEIAYHGSGRRARHWRVAIVTGLLGFLLAAVLFTVPELVAGNSAAGDGRSTTLFGGSKHGAAGTPAQTTTTATETQPTVTTPALDEDETVTVPPQTVTTPPPAVTTPEEPATTVPTTTVPPPPVAEPPPAEVPPG